MDTSDTEKTLFKVGNFVAWQKNDTLVLSPSFQRRSVWSKGAKSLLIDSVVRGLPIPIIFLRDRISDLEKLETKIEVVDGQQRLRTLLSFIDPNLLKDFKKERDMFQVRPEHNKEIANKNFKDLPEDIRRKILDYRFSVHIFPSSVDDAQILEIFSRMNSTGMRLNPQELRNSRYFGIFRISNNQLASEQLPRWRNWKLFTEDNIARMLEVEMTSELTIIILRGDVSSRAKTIDKYYKDFEENYPLREEVEKRFRLVMDTIEESFGERMKYLRIRKTLFYSLFAAIYFLLYGIKTKVDNKQKPDSIKVKKIDSINEALNKISEKKVDQKVIASLTKRTTDRSSRKILLEYLLGL